MQGSSKGVAWGHPNTIASPLSSSECCLKTWETLSPGNLSYISYKVYTKLVLMNYNSGCIWTASLSEEQKFSLGLQCPFYSSRQKRKFHFNCTLLAWLACTLLAQVPSLHPLLFVLWYQSEQRWCAEETIQAVVSLSLSLSLCVALPHAKYFSRRALMKILQVCQQGSFLQKGCRTR